jgi:predicted deacylase
MQNFKLSLKTVIIVLIITILGMAVGNGQVLAASSQNTVKRYTLAANTKYSTDLYVIESNKPGPVVMIVGGVHGSEKAGYTAANQVKNWTIDKGTLLVLPRANQRAIAKERRAIKGEGNLNRVFPRSKEKNPHHPLAADIWSVVKKYKVDWLMDMHEGVNYTKKSNSVGQSLIYYPDRQTRLMAKKIMKNLNQGISTSYKKLSLKNFPVKGSLARSSGQYLGVNSIIFETCDNPSLSVRVNYQLKAARTLLQELDML